MSFRHNRFRTPFVSAGSGAPYSSGSTPNGTNVQRFGSVPPPASLTAGVQISGSLGSVKPPASYSGNRSGSSSGSSADQFTELQSYGSSAKKRKGGGDDDDYFDDDEEEDSKNSVTVKPLSTPEEDEEDPLDAFMADITKEATKPSIPSKKPVGKPVEEPKKSYRADIEEEDSEESYYRFMAENPNAGVATEEDNLPAVEYDEDGNPIAPERSKIIEPLPPVDHSLINYPSFAKDFYDEHSEIAQLSEKQVDELRKRLGIKVTGADAPKPVASFGHFKFDESLMNSIRKNNFTQPTPIQAQAIPAILQGRDVIGIAKTGSGKTVAYLWPMLTHVLDQPPLKPGDGPIGLILAPTRELAQQIYLEVKRFGSKVYNITTTCCAGGANKHEQTLALRDGAEIVVATPGRMIDLIKSGATNLQRVTFFVLDEADRMLDLGFEPQVRSISNHIRPDRQTLLFSATFRKKIEKLARDALNDPIKIVQGELGEANEDVTQFVKVTANQEEKFSWLLKNIVAFTSAGSVLIFVTKKADCEAVANRLQRSNHKCVMIHGDLHQTERDKVIHQFKKKEVSIMVATDVAARGLDIPSIRTVVNFDVARDIDTHTHRIGRTGRAGEQGKAWTLITEKDKEFAPHLVRNLEGANQHVPESLMELASQCSWFKKTRFTNAKGKKPVGGRGLGFKESNSSTGSEVSASDMIKSIKKEASSASDSPGSIKAGAVKAAFQARFKSQFVTSSSAETGAKNQPQDDGQKKRKTRWE